MKMLSERPNLHFVGSAEPMPNHDLSGRTDAEPMPNLNQQFRYKTSNFSMQFFSLLSYMLKNQAEFLKLDSIHQFMLPSKSCKTINANFLLKNFGLTFFDMFKTGTSNNVGLVVKSLAQFCTMKFSHHNGRQLHFVIEWSQ